MKDMNFRLVTRVHEEEPKASLEGYTLQQAEAVRDFHKSFPMYAPTPLALLPETARALGVGEIYVKNESYRFGLNAFKVLGGSYAIGNYLAKRLGKSLSETGYDVLTAPETRSSSPVRFPRNENMEGTFDGLYPAGEGAGYAGGITSAACDGIKIAEKIIGKYALKGSLYER